MTDSMTDVREVIENVLYLETEMERYECVAKADAILSALSSHGLKVVGREPTDLMCRAMQRIEGPRDDTEEAHAERFRAAWDAAE